MTRDVVLFASSLCLCMALCSGFVLPDNQRWKPNSFLTPKDLTHQTFNESPRIGNSKSATILFFSKKEARKENKGAVPSEKLNPFIEITLSLAFAASILFANPLPSNAGFGSGGAAVSSFPEIKPLPTEEFLRLSPSKQRQREFSVSCLQQSGGVKGQYCETGVNRLYNEVKKKNLQTLEDEKAQEQFAEMEQRVLTKDIREEFKEKALNDESARLKEYEYTLQLEESLRQQKELLEKLGRQPTWVSYLAAGVGSVVSTVIMHPVDTIKVQLMNSKKGEEDEDEESGDDENGSIDIRGVYKGVVANIFKEAPSSALYLGVYEIIRAFLSGTVIGGEPLLVYLIAGATGEVFGSVLRAPMEAVKTRLQVSDDDENEVTTLGAAEEVFFTGAGRDNLFRSWSASLLRDVPMGAVQLAIFESIKSFVINSPDINLDVSSLRSEALFGALGGSIGAFITTPADIVTTISINSLSDSNLAEFRDKTPFEVFNLLLAQGGVGALFTGWKERILYWAPAIGIFLSIYCGSRQFALVILKDGAAIANQLAS